MELEYRRNLRQSYMIVTLEQIEIGYQTEMCRRNKIPGFLEMETVIADGKMQVWYNITGHQSLEEYLKYDKLDYRLLKALVQTVRQAVEGIHDYLLDEEGLLLQPEFIFIGNTKETVKFCYCKESGEPLQKIFRNLVEYLLTKINHSDEQAVTAGYEIYQLTLSEGYDIEQIWNVLLDEIKLREIEVKPAGRKESVQEEIGQEKVLQNATEIKKVEQSFYIKFKEKIMEYVRQKAVNLKILKSKIEIPKIRHHTKKIEERIFTFEEVQTQEIIHPTILLGELSKAKQEMGELIYIGKGNGKDLTLDKSPFVIGSKTGVDGVIDYTGVSRLHAKILKESEIYYLEDMNSTNGTKVNGVLLNYMEHVPLYDGDEVQFGESTYKFGWKK